MSFYTLRRIFSAALRAGAVWFAATAGERLAKKYIKLPVHRARGKRSTTTRKRNRKGTE